MVQDRSSLAKCLIDSTKTTELSQIWPFPSVIIMHYIYDFVHNKSSFTIWSCFTLIVCIQIVHYSMSSLLPAIKHLERTLQATFIIDDSKNVSAQFSEHLFIFSIRTFSDRQSPINFR